MSSRVIDIKNLSFSYDNQRVLQDITFDVREHQFTSVIGPNGGGKSTLVKLMLGLLEPDNGDIKILGKSPKDSREEIGYVPQYIDVNLDFPITVLDVVMMGNKKMHSNTTLSLFWRLFPIKYNDIEIKCAYSTLQKVGMQDYMDRKIKDLSGGQRQRVMIARALCSHPKVLILDEPTSNIDPKGQKEIFELLKELNKDLTVFVVSHDLAVVSEYAQKIIYINREAFVHDLGSDTLGKTPKESGHFCQVEMIQMLKAIKDDRSTKL